MSDFKIEKGVPVPAKNPGKVKIYPFGEMEVGDSFAFDPSQTKKSSVSNAAASFGLRRGWKFSVRNHGDVCRCFRVA